MCAKCMLLKDTKSYFIEIIFLTFILIAQERINERLCGELSQLKLVLLLQDWFLSALSQQVSPVCKLY